ncbi:MAG TPA: hypothetical protein VFT98_02625, partial [Myxococcota bacterium]|nr:hypothetical protein [Myxococcota bacterium]
MRHRLLNAGFAIAGVIAFGLSAAPADAQAPGARISIPAFESWAPLGEYERTAFAEEGSLRIVIPTKQRNVEIAFAPGAVLDEDYGAEQIDRGGLRTGAARPAFTAYTGRVIRNSGRDFAKLGVSAERGRLEGLLRIDGAFYAVDADLAADDYVISVREVDEAEVAALARTCGVTAEELSLPATGPAVASDADGTAPGTAVAVSLREIELGTEADA